MRNAIALAFSTVALLWAPSALPCGGGFGYGLKLNPDQKIVIRHKSGVETYFFSPHFCGLSAHFGLILPVPTTLVAPPKLGEAKTVSQLEDLTKAEVVHRTLCDNLDGVKTGVAGGRSNSADAGASVQVIDKGKVGIFDWTLIKADTSKAFTDWLDANRYPYDTASSTQFAAYVTSGWYFVAFKVTADAQDPPQGRELCGDLGPIQLAFQADTPVIPSRIAAASSAGDAGPYISRLQWRVFAIAEHELTSSTAWPQRRFSGALTTDQLSTHSALNGLANDEDHVGAGERLTELDFNFYPAQIQSDIVLTSTATDTDYRRTEYVDTYIQCDAGVDVQTLGKGGSRQPDGGVAGRDDAGGSAGHKHDGRGGAGGTNDERGGATGTGGAAGNAVTHAGGAAGAVVTVGAQTKPTPEQDGGCSVSSRGTAGAWVTSLAAAVVAWAARRRRRTIAPANR